MNTASGVTPKIGGGKKTLGVHAFWWCLIGRLRKGMSGGESEVLLPPRRCLFVGCASGGANYDASPCRFQFHAPKCHAHAKKKHATFLFYSIPLYAILPHSSRALLRSLSGISSHYLLHARRNYCVGQQPFFRLALLASGPSLRLPLRSPSPWSDTCRWGSEMTWGRRSRTTPAKFVLWTKYKKRLADSTNLNEDYGQGDEYLRDDVELLFCKSTASLFKDQPTHSPRESNPNIPKHTRK